MNVQLTLDNTKLTKLTGDIKMFGFRQNIVLSVFKHLGLSNIIELGEDLDIKIGSVRFTVT